MLQNALGKGYLFRTASILHMAAELAQNHEHSGPPKVRRSRGRPVTKKKKKARYDGWNAFVASNPTLLAADGPAIKSGAYLRAASQLWSSMSVEEKQPYVDIAMARQGRLAAEDCASSSDRESENEGEPDGKIRGPWGIGAQDYPLAPSFLAAPEYTEAFAQDVEGWAASLGAEVPHRQGALPYPGKTRHYKVCDTGACATDPHFGEAQQILSRFRGLCPTYGPCDLFLFSAGSEEGQERHTAVYMVAYRRSGPHLAVFLEMRPVEPTTIADLKSQANLPWRLTFLRTRHDEASLDLLALQLDIHSMLSLVRTCQADSLDDIAVRELQYTPCSLSDVDAHTLGPLKGLQSGDIQDLCDLQDCHDSGDEDLADLRSMQHDVAPAPGAADADAEDDDDDGARGEYEFEARMRASAQRVLRLIHDYEEDCDDGDGALQDTGPGGTDGESDQLPLMALLRQARARLRHGRESASSSSRPPRPWDWYGQFLVQDPHTPRKQQVVDKSGVIVGEIAQVVDRDGI